MDKVWFIRIGSVEEGPFSFQDLRCDCRITPDTLVWKKGFARWIAIRYVVELKELFKDRKDPSTSDEDTTKKRKPKEESGDEVMTLSYEPFHLWIWLLILVLSLLYALHKLDWF